METKPIRITSKLTGEDTDALEVLCPECHHHTFRIIIIHGHNHLLCEGCLESFCQNGKCE